MITYLKLFLKFIKFIFPYRKKWLIMILLSMLAMLLNLVNPYLSKLIIDRGISNRDIKTFIFLILAATSVLILVGLLEAWRDFLNRYINLHVRFDLSLRLFRHIQRISLAKFQNRSSGEFLYKIGYDIDRTADFITTVPNQAVTIFPRIIFTLIIIFFLNWQMAIFSILIVPFLYLPNFYFTRRIRNLWKELFNNYDKLFKYMQEVFSRLILIKAFDRERHSFRIYLKMVVENMRISMRNLQWEILRSFTGNTLSRLLISLIIFYGGHQVIRGEMTLGSLTAIMVYLTQLMLLQNHWVSFFHFSIVGLVSCERLAQIFDEAEEKKEDKEIKVVRFLKGEIVFREITFGYHSDRLIFDRISFTIEGGSHIGLIGPSGCGKTTLINLILRILLPLKGEIMIDGNNINHIKSDVFYEQIGVVLQEPYLFNDTIENNIRYGRQQATFDEIREAANIACIDDFINTLPQGYKTIIGENACKLSQGQKQRIAIARAVIKKPKILILDEAFSCLDLQTEDILTNNLKDYFKKETLIFVTHRLNTLKKLDILYFLKNPGKIIVGRPEEILKENAHLDAINQGI